MLEVWSSNCGDTLHTLSSFDILTEPEVTVDLPILTDQHHVVCSDLVESGIHCHSISNSQFFNTFFRSLFPSRERRRFSVWNPLYFCLKVRPGSIPESIEYHPGTHLIQVMACALWTVSCGLWRVACVLCIVSCAPVPWVLWPVSSVVSCALCFVSCILCSLFMPLALSPILLHYYCAWALVSGPWPLVSGA